MFWVLDNIFNSTLKILSMAYVYGAYKVVGVYYVQKCFCDEIKDKNKDQRL